MTRDQIMKYVAKVFGAVPRPEMFIRGTCGCEECREHEAAMQTFDPFDLPLEKLDNPGWDPICFAPNAAFAYFMPGLVRRVCENTGDYVTQVIFHVEQTERLETLLPEQAEVLVQLLDYVVIHAPEALEENRAVDALFRARRELARIAGCTRR